MRLVDRVRLVPSAKSKRVPRTSAVAGSLNMRSQVETVEFQSSIERDFAILCDFAPEVNHIRWQPFSIEFRDLVSDKTRTYTPDYLVETTSRRGERYSYIAEIKRYREYSRIYEADPVGEASRAHIAATEWARAQPLSEMVVCEPLKFVSGQ